MTQPFADFTGVERVDTDEFSVDIDPSSFIVRGPNGGYLAALLLRAIETRVGDLDGPARPPRSLTVHYPAAPHDGAARITTEVLRIGRSLVSVEARLEQDGKPLVVALAALSPSWPSEPWGAMPPPAIPSWEDLPAPPMPPVPLPFMSHWERRHAIGPDLWQETTDLAETGGWLRMRNPSALDAPAVAAITDAWPPAVFARFPSGTAVPTVDLTVHFRTAVPTPAVATGDPVIVRFRTRMANEGFIEEDGEVWSQDGMLLAHSRQLAVLLPG